MAKEIEFTIKAGTNEIAIETFGVKGQECTKMVEKAQVALGGTLKDDKKKPEYWDSGKTVHITANR